ncbi:MAG: hypothetical protein LBH58_00385 [Tannerellaceae bacterium]|jgi:hypothetical protein|nr:hypothetical protein [Tannerellaceae bacterium]
MKKLIGAFFLLLMFTSMVHAQNRIRVHVVNEKDEPLGGAIVYVLSSDSLFINSIIANEEGIADIPPIDFSREAK